MTCLKTSELNVATPEEQCHNIINGLDKEEHNKVMSRHFHDIRIEPQHWRHHAKNVRTSTNDLQAMSQHHGKAIKAKNISQQYRDIKAMLGHQSSVTTLE